MDLMPFILIGAVILVVVGILVFVGLRQRQGSGDNQLADRLAEFASRGETVSLEELELEQPFVERVLFPVARVIGEFALRFTPQKAIQDVTHKLDMAGNPGNIEPTMFFAFRFFGIPLGGVALLLGNLLKDSMFGKQPLLFVIGLAVLGFFLPDLLLKSRIDRRQDAVRKTLPDALDLVTICVEAGLGFEAALQKVYEKWDNEISRAFGRVIREIQLGKVRREALRDMAERLGLPEMTSFVAAVIQSEQLGVSMAQVLRIQADQMRVRRRQLAEEKAHRAPVLMLIPMGIFIFPSLCIVMMGPAIIQLIQTFML